MAGTLTPANFTTNPYVTTTKETQTATAGQTLFTLATMTYIPASGNIAVYVNGSRNTSFTETSGNVITFSNPMVGGETVLFESNASQATVTTITVLNAAGSAIGLTP